MTSRQVFFHARKNSDPANGNEGLGGFWGWESVDTIIYQIENGIHHYWIEIQGRQVDLSVRLDSDSRKKCLTIDFVNLPAGSPVGGHGSC